MLSPHRPPRDSWLDTVTGKGRITVEPLEWLTLEFICFNLRPVDREEIFDNLPDDNPIRLCASLHQAIAMNGCGWIARLDGRPAGCISIFENFPGNWQVASFGTTDYRRVLVAFKPKLEKLIGFARERGMHRLECKSLADHKDAHRTIRFLGMGDPQLLRCYGRKRQDYICFSRVWPDE